MTAKKVGKFYDGEFLSCRKASDENGWIDAMKFTPTDFRLVDLKIQGKDKIYKGWISMKKWDGLKVRCDDIVTHWKLLDKGEQLKSSMNR